jgi:hypothetical protein
MQRIVTLQSVIGSVVFLKRELLAARYKMQERVGLSVTIAELIAATNCAHDMVYFKNALNSIGLVVKLPMEIIVDSKGVKDLIDHWSVECKTRHIGVHFQFLSDKLQAKRAWTRSLRSN